jgi:outer membrane protein assembly factor BamD (BamD/ComL family)
MKIWFAVGVCAAILLAACSSEQSDWRKASASDTVAAYQQFLREHPNTTRSVEARNRIRAMEDEQAWARAQQANTVAAYQDYLKEQPAGIHVEEAKDHIAANERMSAWTAASAANTPEALESFLEKYPQGPEADQAKAKLAQLTGYRVQLASYRSEQRAQKTRDRLQGKYGDVLGNVVVVPEAGSNVVRSAPMGEAEANNACAKLKRAHLSCEVIKDANS